MAARRAVALSLLVLGVGCARTPWTVVRASGPPSALRGAPAIGVVLDATGLVIDGVPIASLSGPDLDATMAALVAFESHFRNELVYRVEVPVQPADDRLTPGAAVVTIRLHELALERGFGGSRGELLVTLDWSRDGTITDSISLDAWPYRGHRLGMMAMWDRSRRLAALAEELAEAAGVFFRREQGR